MTDETVLLDEEYSVSYNFIMNLKFKERIKKTYSKELTERINFIKIRYFNYLTRNIFIVI